jgi:ABC-2 type transport system permease protein
MNARFLALEVRRAVRNTRYLLFTVVMPSVMFLLFVSLYNAKGQVFPNGLPVTTSLMLNMAVFGLMSAPLAAGARIAVERGTGWQRQLRLTPLSSAGYVLTKGALGMVIALPGIVLVMLLGGFVEDVRMSAVQWVEVGGGLWLGTLPFVLIGIVIGLLATADGMQAITGVLSMAFGLLGGIWIPAEVAPGWLSAVMHVMPTYWVKVVGQAPLVGGADLGTAVLVIGCWVLGLGFVAAKRFQTDTARV